MSKSLLKRQLESDQLEMNLIAKASDISWQAFDGERQPLRNTAENMINLGQVPFKEPKDIITREMIQDYHDNLENKPAYIGRDDGEEYKYFPSGIRFTPDMFKKPNFGNASGLDRPATQQDLDNAEEAKKVEIEKIADVERQIETVVFSIREKEEQIDSTHAKMIDLLKEQETIRGQEREAHRAAEAQEAKMREMEKTIEELKEYCEKNADIMDARDKRKKNGEIKKESNLLISEEKIRKVLVGVLHKMRQVLTELDENVRKTGELFETLKAETDVLRKQQGELEAEYGRLLKNADDIEAIKDALLKNIDENKKEESSVKRENKNLLYKYEDALLHANRNKLSVHRDVRETDAEYLQRLNAIEATKFDPELYRDKANLIQVRLLKENLQHITKDESVIENIIKTYSPEGKFKINKNFTAIKKILLDTFGYNNNNLISTDVIDTIDQYFYKLTNPFDDKVIEEEPLFATAVPMETEGEDVKLRVEDNALHIMNKKNGKLIFLKIGRGNGRGYILFSRTENKKNCFKNVQGRGDHTLKFLFFEYLELTEKDLITIFGDANVKYIKDLYDLLKSKYNLYEVNADVKRSDGHVEVGYGLNLNSKSETDSLKERLQILEGEIAAGNDNIQLIKEIKEILVKMIQAGLISQANAKKYLNQFI